MSERILIEEARHRKRVFESLDKWLGIIHSVVKGMDSEADVYLFGSLAEGRHTYSSDIDILIVTKRKPEVVIAELWKAHVTSPFEIHVIPPERLYLYAKRGRLLRLGSEGRKEN